MSLMGLFPSLQPCRSTPPPQRGDQNHEADWWVMAKVISGHRNVR
jgi:hypothetical protein